MAPDRSTSREDLRYLSRRIKPGATSTAASAAVSEPATATPPPVAGPAAGLSLKASPKQVNTGAAAPLSAKPELDADISVQAFTAPALGSIRHLSGADPVVRLTPRQSGIGSLLVAVPRSAAWEDNALLTGAMTKDGHTAGIPLATSGKRSLVDFHEGSAVVNLRHVRSLRRALFIAGETPLTAGVFDGSSITCPARSKSGDRAILYVCRIGAVLEFRLETMPGSAEDPDIWAAFGFTMSTALDRRAVQT